MRIDSFGRSDGLFVVQPHQTFFLRFAHQVTDGIAFGYVEIVVGFHAACVRMGGHGVPYRAGSQFRKAHLQLFSAALLFPQHVFHNQLVYDAVVAVFHLSVAVGDAQRIFLGFGFLEFGIGRNQLGYIRLISRSRVDVNLAGRVASLL